MPNSAQIQFNEIDMSFDVASIIDGVAGVMGVTQMGPVMRPDIIINTWNLFQKYYGSFIDGNDFPLLCYRALTYYGLQLRVCAIRHFTDITDVGTLTALAPGSQTISNQAVDALGLVQNAVNVKTTDGILPVGAYTYFVWGINANGRTLPTASIDGTVIDNPTGKNSLTWTTLGEGITYGIKRTLAGNSVYFTSNTNSFVDDGTNAGAAGTTPVADTTGIASQIIGTFVPKFPGANYNNLSVVTQNSTNGLAGYVDIMIFLYTGNVINANTLETYPNLKVDSNLAPADQHWADNIINNSYLVGFTYSDLTGKNNLIPELGNLVFAGGSDGGEVQPIDYMGNSANKTGIWAFDAQDDMFYISAPASIDPDIANAGASYASQRKDLVYFVHLDHTLTDPASLVAARQLVNNADSYTAFFTGGVKITHPVTGATIIISELGDILGIHALSDDNYGPQFSAASTNRGMAKSVLGSGNNFGSKGNYGVLNQLANAQINCMITAKGKTYISGNFTGQVSSNTVAASKLSYLSIRKMLISVEDTLAVPIQQWIEEPADIPTFAGIYNEVKPYLETLKTNRSVYDYRWYGDQYVTDITKVVINNAADLDIGKVTAQLWVKPINSTQWIIVNLYIVNSAYAFEDALN